MSKPPTRHLTLRLAALALLVVLSATAPAAWAQKVYRCKVGSTTSLSDRPCPDSDATQQTPVQVSTAPPPSVIRQGAAQYLNPMCAQIYEALRSAPSRGVNVDTQADLAKEFRSKCSESAREANLRYLQAAVKEGEEARAQRAAQQREKELETASRDQCAELRRILTDRRKRQDAMTDGEKSDLQRFEGNYNARCKAG